MHINAANKAATPGRERATALPVHKGLGPVTPTKSGRPHSPSIISTEPKLLFKVRHDLRSLTQNDWQVGKGASFSSHLGKIK